MLPTGCGKSLFFSVLSRLKKDCDLSIVKDQIKEATSMGIIFSWLVVQLPTNIHQQ